MKRFNSAGGLVVLTLSLWILGHFNLGAQKAISDREEACRERMLKVHQAIQEYRKDHKDLPPDLQTLVPKYIPEVELLRCPLREQSSEGMYLFEFSPRSISNVSGLTQRKWKEAQMGLVGGIVPIIRCGGHAPIAFNVGFDGK